MGIAYRYANYTKKEWLERFAVGNAEVTSRVINLFLLGEPDQIRNSNPQTTGRWAGDSIAIIGDDQIVKDWDRIVVEFKNVKANAIVTLFDDEGFDGLGRIAENDNLLYAQLCYLITTRQCPEFESHMRRKFGEHYLRRYKHFCLESPWHKPADLVV